MILNGVIAQLKIRLYKGFANIKGRICVIVECVEIAKISWKYGINESKKKIYNAIEFLICNEIVIII